MTTQQIAEQLVALCRQGKNLEADQTLSRDDVVSVEVAAGPDSQTQSRGKQAVIGKNQRWFENQVVHGGAVQDPFVGPGQFAILFAFDVTSKPEDRRLSLREMGLCTDENGKITREGFFYNWTHRA